MNVDLFWFDFWFFSVFICLFCVAFGFIFLAFSFSEWDEYHREVSPEIRRQRRRWSYILILIGLITGFYGSAGNVASGRYADSQCIVNSCNEKLESNE